jgi:hypothetical protein
MAGKTEMGVRKNKGYCDGHKHLDVVEYRREKVV